MKAKSIQGKSPTEIKVALERCMADGFQPTLALAFVSTDVDRDGICNILDKENITIFGATSGGGFIDGDIQTGTAVLLLMEMDQNHFKLLFEGECENPRSMAQNMAKTAVESVANPAFITCGSGIETDGERIIRGIEDAAGTDTIIYGGMAAAAMNMQETFVFTNGESSNQGIVMLVLDADIFELKGRATCGWSPYGTEKTITKSEGWWIHDIDNQPAMDLINKYMGLSETGKKGFELTSPQDAVDYPLLVYREEGEPIIRPVLAINWDDRSVRVNGPVDTGQKIRFAMAADFKVIDQVILECKDVQRYELDSADAVIVFSCFGRMFGFGPLIGKEIQGIQETYNAPMAGFFTFGEFGRATNGNHEYHNLTCCWVALKEK